MTQKELLYLEDAVNHEKSIISIISESIKNISDEDLKIFLEGEIKAHESLENSLISLMEEKSNE